MLSSVPTMPQRKLNGIETEVAVLRTEAGRNPTDTGPDRPHRRVVHPQPGVPHRSAAHNVRRRSAGSSDFITATEAGTSD